MVVCIYTRRLCKYFFTCKSRINPFLYIQTGSREKSYLDMLILVFVLIIQPHALTNLLFKATRVLFDLRVCGRNVTRSTVTVLWHDTKGYHSNVRKKCRNLILKHMERVNGMWQKEKLQQFRDVLCCNFLPSSRVTRQSLRHPTCTIFSYHHHIYVTYIQHICQFHFYSSNYKILYMHSYFLSTRAAKSRSKSSNEIQTSAPRKGNPVLLLHYSVLRIFAVFFFLREILYSFAIE